MFDEQVAQALGPKAASLLSPLTAFAIGSYIIIYRLFLSPIAKFPGPKIAALTNAYQFYFDVIKGGRMPWELARLHDKYGPIVRISPTEVHVSDPYFYDVLYPGNNHRRDKDIFGVAGYGNSGSVSNTEKHEHHRMRRTPLNPFFSTQAITRFEPVIRSKLEALCSALRQKAQSGEPVNLEFAFMAYTTDIISEYAFGMSYGFLDKPDFAPDWAKLMSGCSESMLIFRYLPILMTVIEALPPNVVERLDPKMITLINLQKKTEVQVKAIKETSKSEKMSAKYKTIFHEVLLSDLPESEKSVTRLTQEAQLVLAAGSITTAHFLKTTIYFILANEKILHRSKAELIKAIPDPQSLPGTHQLEQLPYSAAIVKEGSRMTDGVIGRLSRIAPDQDLKYQDWVIPKGTSISMSSYIQHRNPESFPKPETFDPDRWLGEDSGKLGRYLVNFSKGARACLGINLAKTEIYLTLATIFRRFDLELFETERERDVDTARDLFIPYTRKDSKGIRVVFKEC